MANLQLTQCVLLVTFISLLWNGTAGRKCLDIIPTGGYTFPQGDIILEKGSDLNITCVLNRKYASKYGPSASSLLSFLLGDDHIPSEIVNSTARRLFVKNHPLTEKADYYCLMNGTYICHNVIAIGTKPQNVTDFDCMGQNLNNFTCSWTAPLNYVHTNYYLTYTPVTPSGRSLISECPHDLNETKIGNKTIMSCTWSLSSTPLYRHSHSSFKFRLSVNDTFGSRNWTFLIDHYSRVRPDPPTELGAISKSPHSIQLEWSLPVLMLSFPGGLRYRVCWCNEQSKEWNTIYLPNKTLSKHFYVKDQHRYFLLDNLPYAHCIYDIRISMQPRVAADDRMWSENTSITIRTLSKLPDCPPNTTLGGFEILDGVGKRIIYWQSIHSYQENGDNLTYKIQEIEDPSIKPVELLKKYAVFNELPNRNLTFKIWSVNNEGKSLDHSVVFLPAEKYALKPVRKLIKKDNGNGKYNIQWIDSGDPKTTHYTLFWCTALMERPYPCQGNLNWLTVQRGMKNKTLQLPVFDTENNRSISNYQFAISVNGIDSSSGLLWADCTILHGRGKRKLSQTYLKTVSSRYIVIQIHLGCITLTDIQGFNVSYCQILQPGSEECQPNTLKYKFFYVDNDTFDGDAELNITNLVPYTGYQIRVKPVVLGSELEFGDSMFNSTIEDTPSEPTNVQVLRREPRLLSLHWEPPEEANGHIREYRIYVRSRTQTLPPITVPYVHDLKFYSWDIKGLLPRSRYTIGVSACTKTCSSYATINASTDINCSPWCNYKAQCKLE